MVAGLGHLPMRGDTPASQYARLPASDKFLMCNDDMIFVPAVNLGDAVREGDILGQGWLVDRVDTEPKTYFYPMTDGCFALADKDCLEGGCCCRGCPRRNLRPGCTIKGLAKIERLSSNQASVFNCFSVVFLDKSSPLRVIESKFATGAWAPFNVATVTPNEWFQG